MKDQVYVPDPLNEQASVFVDAQTDLKTAIKQGVLSGKGKETIKGQVNKIIDLALEKIRSPTLKEDGKTSLMRFADSVYERFTDELKFINPMLLPALVVLIRAVTAKERQGDVYNPSTQTERQAFQRLSAVDPLTFNTRSMGIPLQEFQKNYIARVTESLNNLAEENALDPNDFTGRNSLRNLAEMQVRYERHQEEIANFKSKGTRLVVCSVHADCSERCSEWQGRVYSMDGTSGYTEDGKRFVPLEKATDIYYTTKAGRVYKNGLLGFNCRHKLYEYKNGMGIPTVSAEERKREYAITQKQRAMERGVIEAREEALIDKGVNNAEYSKWRKIAIARNKAYIEFSKENGRAYYPDRVKIL